MNERRNLSDNEINASMAAENISRKLIWILITKNDGYYLYHALAAIEK
jgi:hypothetical protein